MTSLTTLCTAVLLTGLLAGLLAGRVAAAQEVTILRSVRECLRTNGSSILCFKEKALKIIDEVVASDQPLQLTDYIDVVRDPSYPVNQTDELELPRDLNERSSLLNKLLSQRIDDFFESRTLKINLASVFEGRAKKGGKKGGGMMMMAGIAMAGMMAQLFMGKIAFMAGTAMMLSKMALLLSSIIGLKKLVSGGGSSDGHVVYASTDYGHSHGGGWHRSLTPEDEAAILAYRSQNKENYV